MRQEIWKLLLTEVIEMLEIHLNCAADTPRLIRPLLFLVCVLAQTLYESQFPHAVVGLSLWAKN